VVDFRIYRAGFFPALVAIVALLFALQAPPEPLPETPTPVEFQQLAAAKRAHQILATAPARPPGSPGDARIADMVEGQFKHVTAGQVTEQRFTGSFDGDDVDLRNVILTLPGQTTRSVVVMASRDSASGPGAASSAAATATLLELVNELRLTRHTKTLVFVSTDAGSDGAIGAKQFAAAYPQRAQVDGVVVISQPGSATPTEPSLVDGSDGPQSANAQLASTGRVALTDQTTKVPTGETIFGELARLALPSGLGEQAPLIAGGIPAIALSSAGERPLRVSQDQPDDLSANTLGAFGRSTLQLIGTLDGAPAPPQRGPDAYLHMAGNLVPGWTLSLLAVTLMVPSALACVDAVARARRARQRLAPALAWSLSRGLPLIGALIVLYLMAVVGIVARPDFPFDPNSFGVGAGQVIAMIFLAAVALGGYYVLRGWRVPAGMPASVAVPALGAASLLGTLIAWLANPYLGLLAVPIAHVWLLEARRARPLPWPLVAVGAAIALLPLTFAFAHLVARLDLGAGALWLLLLMIDDGQIGFWTMLALCVLLGSLIGIVAFAARPRTPASPVAPTRMEPPPTPQAEPVQAPAHHRMSN
jgi:Peptidase family M28